MNPTQSAVNGAANLQDLCDILNAHEITDDGENVETLADVVDLCGLPTFGGTPPSNTAEVWSWDSDSVLLFNNEYYIEKRDPDAWYDRGNTAIAA